MKCIVCSKEKKKWYVCDTCTEILKKKYPNNGDFTRAIKEHKKEQLRGGKK